MIMEKHLQVLIIIPSHGLLDYILRYTYSDFHWLNSFYQLERCHAKTYTRETSDFRTRHRTTYGITTCFVFLFNHTYKCLTGTQHHELWNMCEPSSYSWIPCRVWKNQNLCYREASSELNGWHLRHHNNVQEEERVDDYSVGYIQLSGHSRNHSLQTLLAECTQK